MVCFWTSSWIHCVDMLGNSPNCLSNVRVCHYNGMVEGSNCSLVWLETHLGDLIRCGWTLRKVKVGVL
jgi:hypothetical protein